MLGIGNWLSSLFTNYELIFRLYVTGILTYADVAIAYILKRKAGLLVAAVFFLNPISIITTGFQNQFDNLAILFGLVAVLLIERAGQKINSTQIMGLALLGVSLMTKHLLFLLPVWLFIRAKNPKIKIMSLLFPIIIFLCGFIPFLPVGQHGIVQNVFLYSSFANAPLLHLLMSQDMILLISPMAFMITLLIVAAFIFRRANLLESFMWYLVILVVFAPAIANQYLAIVSPAIAVLGIRYFMPYILGATYLLAGSSHEGLHLINTIPAPQWLFLRFTPDGVRGEYKWIILLLFVGAICLFFVRFHRKFLQNIRRKFIEEIKFQRSCFAVNKTRNSI